MTYVPALPSGAYIGWLALKRSGGAQKAALEQTAGHQRQAQYFRSKINSVDTAEELVSDRRLLSVALGAFGLEADINSRFFIRKVLEGGTLSQGALALRLADPRYRDLAAAFGFGDFPVPSSKRTDFADKMLQAWSERTFERAVGNVNEALRLALNAERELPRLALASGSDKAKWYSVLGQPPLRELFRTVFGLPIAFGALELDRQIDILSSKSDGLFGNPSPAQFSDPERLDTLIKRYLLQSDVGAGALSGGAAVRGSAALQLLSMSPSQGIA